VAQRRPRVALVFRELEPAVQALQRLLDPVHPKEFVQRRKRVTVVISPWSKLHVVGLEAHQRTAEILRRATRHRPLHRRLHKVVHRAGVAEVGLGAALFFEFF